MALLTEECSKDIWTAYSFSDLSYYEVNGTGYFPGGNVIDGVEDIVVWRASETGFDDARYGVIYQDDSIISIVDFGRNLGNKTSSLMIHFGKEMN